MTDVLPWNLFAEGCKRNSCNREWESIYFVLGQSQKSPAVFGIMLSVKQKILESQYTHASEVCRRIIPVQQNTN